MIDHAGSVYPHSCGSATVKVHGMYTADRLHNHCHFFMICALTGIYTTVAYKERSGKLGKFTFEMPEDIL